MELWLAADCLSQQLGKFQCGELLSLCPPLLCSLSWQLWEVMVLASKAFVKGGANEMEVMPRAVGYGRAYHAYCSKREYCTYIL